MEWRLRLGYSWYMVSWFVASTLVNAVSLGAQEPQYILPTTIIPLSLGEGINNFLVTALEPDLDNDRVIVGIYSTDGRASVAAMARDGSAVHILHPPPRSQFGMIQSIRLLADELFVFDPANGRLLVYNAETLIFRDETVLPHGVTNTRIGFSGGEIIGLPSGGVALTATQWSEDELEESRQLEVGAWRLRGDREPEKLHSFDLRRVDTFEFINGRGIEATLSMPFSTPTSWSLSEPATLVVADNGSGEIIEVNLETGSENVVVRLDELRTGQPDEFAPAKAWIEGGLRFHGTDPRLADEAGLGSSYRIERVLSPMPNVHFLQRSRWGEEIVLDVYCGGALEKQLILKAPSGMPSRRRFSMTVRESSVFALIITETGRHVLEEYDFQENVDASTCGIT